MKLTRLGTGYWHARWSAEIWAQWPCDRPVRAEDFFHPAWTATRERLAECDKVAAPAAEQE